MEGASASKGPSRIDFEGKERSEHCNSFGRIIFDTCFYFVANDLFFCDGLLVFLSKIRLFTKSKLNWRDKSHKNSHLDLF
jgi:hypothetical protein